MTKYCWTFLWQIFICTVFFSWTWSGVIDLNKLKCADNEFGYKSPNGQLICKPCVELPKCASGLGASVACGNITNAHIHCLQCVLGKNFSSVYDSLPCEPCQSTVCHENEKITGSCKRDKDTSKCSGVCKKGFYSIDGNLNNCQPCSLCLNNASARLVKCKDDGLPVGKQCEVGLIVTPVFPTKKKLPSKKHREKHNKVGGYQFYGHPVLFSFLLVVIVVLAIILTFVILRRKFQKKTQSPVVALNQVSNNNDESGDVVETTHDETHDHYDASSPVPAVETVRGRKSSSGSGGPRVSFSRQISSNSNDGLDVSGGIPDSVQSPAAVDELLEEKDVFEEKNLGRKRTLSSSSGKRGRFFGRQNSNPAKEQDEEKPFQRRSSTFSNFSTLFSGEKTGTTEEKTSLLDHNDNDILPEVVALPPESSSEPHRLSGLKIGDLNAEIHRQLCIRLNQNVPNKDWRTLAGNMNYTIKEVKEFARNENPTDKLLDCWGTCEGNDVACLIKHLKDINRIDLVEFLESKANPTQFYL